MDTHMFSLDSVGTHPDLEERRDLVRSYIACLPTAEGVADISSIRNIVLMAELQLVESAYEAKNYDKCLFQILQLMVNYPSNSYLISRSAKILIDIYDVKNEKLIDQYVAKYTGHYTERLRQVNSLLYNISRDEAAELAYNLINNRNNFNGENQSHYYLLWRICELTSRDETREKIANAYKEKFRTSISAFTYR